MSSGRCGPEAAGFVLAGGQSSRMGMDKALAVLSGQPLIQHAIRILREAGICAAIAGCQSEGLEAYARVIPDAGADQGPLSGVCAALRSAELRDLPMRHAVFLSVDLPLLPPSLIEFLLHHARVTGRAVTLASVNGFPQTFPVILRLDVLAALDVELAGGRRSCFGAFLAAAHGRHEAISACPVEILIQTAQVSHPKALPPSQWFTNINRPGDLRRAEATLLGRSEKTNRSTELTEQGSPDRIA